LENEEPISSRSIQEERMKKKSLPKLTLNRDTLIQLDAPKLEWAAGVIPSAQNSLCDMISCNSNCTLCRV
jgi:hypothetical protein